MFHPQRDAPCFLRSLILLSQSPVHLSKTSSGVDGNFRARVDRKHPTMPPNWTNVAMMFTCYEPAALLTHIFLWLVLYHMAV